MQMNNRTTSLFLVALFVMSTLTALVTLTPEASASNETTSGVITGTETWQGSHTLTGDVEIAPGAKLIIQPGTTVTFLNGTYLHVKGNLCAGDTACGSSSMASNSSRVTFRWGTPANDSQNGRCYHMPNPASGLPLWNPDASCFEGILVRDTVDIAQTKFNHVTIENAYGMPRYVADLSEIRWGALILDGASLTLTQTVFNNINTSSVLVLDLASPTFNGGSFQVGVEEAMESLAGNAVQTYGAGSPNNPVLFNSPVFTGTEKGCSTQDNGRHVLWAQKSFTNIDHGVIAAGDYGYRYTDSAGSISSNTINTDCTGIDVNGRRSILTNDYKLFIMNNSIITGDNSPLTVYDAAYAHVEGNLMEGAAEGSGVQVVSDPYTGPTEVRITDNHIGPIGGYNGIWGVGSFDIMVDNNTIEDINREPFIIGEYHFTDPFWSVGAPHPARATIVDNDIINVSGSCESDVVWDDDAFDCPAFHIFRASASIKRNTVSGVAGDAIRAIGSLIDVQDNQFTVGGQGAKVVDHDHEFASLAFFSGNEWLGVSDIVYNITKSSVTIQSETIPPLSGTNASMPIQLVWDKGEANHYNNWDNQVILPPTISMPPLDFPLSLQAVNNSTVLTYANMSGLSLSKIEIGASQSIWSVQVREASLVRIRATVAGVRVPDATILLEDAHGNDIYDLKTDSQGFAPWVALPSDFHLDIRGNGNNPDGFADDEGEDSCSDGMDNDGDLFYDNDDSDCNDGDPNTREMSKYYVTAYKFGKGYHRTFFNLTGANYEDTLSMSNLAPSVVLSQEDGHSFKRIINFTGYAWDGNIGTGIFVDDEQARWEQQGIVERVEVKTPDSSSWQDIRYAVDNSGSNGEVTYNNRPFKNWFFSYDMSDQAEGDYTFDFRAFDGVDYSPIVTRTIQLNTNPATIAVASPVDGSLHSSGSVIFTGAASDAYNGVLGSDIQKIHFRMSSPTWSTTTTSISRPVDTNGNPIGSLETWSWEWDFSIMPKVREMWTFTIWASDSGYCLEDIDICQAVVLQLDIDNSNAPPVIALLAPYDNEVITVSTDTLISGIASDTDGGVSRVEIMIRDPQDGLRELPNAPPFITTIAGNGLWSASWDTSNLIHDFHYLVSARAFDGHSYSNWDEVEVVIHNPPDADNRAPVFNSTDWVGEIIIFCEEGSQRLDRCGGGGSVELAPHFSDLDADELDFDVWDDPDVIGNSDLQHDLQCYELITVDITGRATYDPVGMSFHTSDMDLWSCEGMKFTARDSSSTAYSMNVDFTVRAVSFTAARVDGLSNLGDGETAVFSGQGRPTVEVVARSSNTGLRLNNTIVGDDGIWTMEIPVRKFEDGVNTVEFEYDEQLTDKSLSVQVGAVDSESGLGWIVWIIISVISLAVLAGVFMFFFVEFEEDIEESLSDEQTQEEVDPYAWGRANEQQTQQQAVAAAPAQQPVAPQPVAAPQPSYPGWKWDPESNQWVPDQ